MAEIEAVDGIEIVDNFRRIAKLGAAMNNDPSTELKAERGELLSSVTNALVGKRVEVVELPSARESNTERSITRYGESNGAQMVRYADAERAAGHRRLHPTTHREYGISNFFRHGRQSRGLVEAIDRSDGSIIVHPWLLGISGIKLPLSRNWVRLFGTQGKQLANLTVIGK